MPFMLPDYTINKGMQERGHDYLATGWGEYFSTIGKSAFRDSGSSALWRMTELEAANSDDPEAYGEAFSEGMTTLWPEGHQKPAPSRLLSQDEWKQSEYFREGLSFPDGVKEPVARIQAERYDDRKIRKDVLSRAPSGWFKWPATLAVSLAASLLDPINVASAYIPIVPQAARLAMAARVGKTMGRLATGAAEGAAGAAMLEPLVYGAAKQEQDEDYSLYNSLMNIAFGTVFGGGLHVASGAIGDVISRVQYKTRETALRVAVAQLGEGKQVNVEPIFKLDGMEGIKKPWEIPREQFIARMIPEETRAAVPIFEKIVYGKVENLHEAVPGMAKERLDLIKSTIETAEAAHEKVIRDAVEAGQPVPLHIVDEYSGKPWAEAYLTKKMHEDFVKDVHDDIIDESYPVVDNVRRSGISLASVRADYGTEGVYRLNKNLPGIVRKNGQALDVLAANNGFEGADALFTYLSEYRPRTKMSEDLSDMDAFNRAFAYEDVEASLEDGMRLSEQVDLDAKTKPKRTSNTTRELEEDLAETMSRVDEMRNSGELDPEREAIMLEAERTTQEVNTIAHAVESAANCIATKLSL